MQHFTATAIGQLERFVRRELINTLPGPKSVHLIGTASGQGITNLALFNSIMHIGANPPLLGCIFRPLTVRRHTYENIKETGFFTINTVQESYLDNAHQTAGKFPDGVSEFGACGLTPRFSDLHPAPYVAESPVQIGLRYCEEHLVATNGVILMVGEIVEIWLQDGLMDTDGVVDHGQAGTVAVSGLDAYYRTAPIKRIKTRT